MNSQVAGAVIVPVWLTGWLFTIVYAKLIWWKAMISIVLWPYYLGVALRPG